MLTIFNSTACTAYLSSKHVAHAGEPQTDITEQPGKRIIKKTGTYSGTELHLWWDLPYYDARLPVREDSPATNFNIKRKEITSTEEWQQVRTMLGSITVHCNITALPPSKQIPCYNPAPLAHIQHDVVTPISHLLNE